MVCLSATLLWFCKGTPMTGQSSFQEATAPTYWVASAPITGKLLLCREGFHGMICLHGSRLPESQVTAGLGQWRPLGLF